MGLRWSHGLLVLLFLAILAFIFTMQFLSPSPAIISRYPGGSKNVYVDRLGTDCNATDPDSWGYGACSKLIICIFDGLSDIEKSDTAIGTTILGLLPSIMLNAAAQPQDIVQLALISPLRGIATAAFTVGFSSGVFEKLKPMGFISTKKNPQTWHIPLAHIGHEWSWKHVFFKLLADVMIVTSAGIMLWQTWLVNSAVLVQWLCQSPLMIFTWPLVNMVWVLVAILLLYGMVDEISFKHATEDETYTWWQVLMMPYNLDVENIWKWSFSCKHISFLGPGAPKWLKSPSIEFTRTPITKSPKLIIPDTVQSKPATPASRSSRPTTPPEPSFKLANSIQGTSDYYIRVVIKMPENSKLKSWDTYFILIEAFAMAIYFYATIVLLSALFIGARGSVKFAALMAGLCVGVRILGSLM